MKNLYFDKLIKTAFDEDGVGGNLFYQHNLPKIKVNCSLNIKQDCLISGLPIFFECFNFLNQPIHGADEIVKEYEGLKIAKNKAIKFESTFDVMLNAERIALNLLQHSTSISTNTNKFVEVARDSGVKIIDTRKTTPGFRILEKYAVRVGGGYNHRFTQTDTWMVKDNHKAIFGSLENAVNYFKNVGSFYNSMVVEIHDLKELQTAIELNIKHVMLDNFSVEDLHIAIALKKTDMTYEVSGGVRLETLGQYLLKGIDAISVGALTYDSPHVDMSLKYSRK